MDRLTLMSFLIMAVPLATALEHFDNFREGSCSEVPLRPVKSSREFVDSLDFNLGGNKYHMYRVASNLPNYGSLREDELYYDFCYTRNTSAVAGYGSSIGFGRTLATYRTITRPGIYMEAIPNQPSIDTLRLTVTLTDNRSFAFLVNCFTGVDQKAFVLLTKSPYLDPKTQKLVEEHAAFLGFKRENFVFLRYESCRLSSNHIG